MLTITDLALRKMHYALGTRTPEQGGALMGATGIPVITDFIHDAGAQTSGIVYHNSKWLLDAIAESESSGLSQFKGIAHSHPHGMPHPSPQDVSEYTETLRNNPHMDIYIAPIVTHDVASPLRNHEFSYAGARYSIFVAKPSFSRSATLSAERPYVMPLMASLENADIATSTSPVLVNSAGHMYLATEATSESLGSFLLLFGMDYPKTAPILVLNDQTSASLSWDLALQEDMRLSAALSKIDSKSARGPASAPLPATLGQTANIEVEDLFARSQGLLSRSLSHKRVLVIGAGSVGSYVAELLARAGVSHLTVVDPDLVEAHNIGRSLFTARDVGSAKVEAVLRRVREIGGSTRVETVHKALGDVDDDALMSMFDFTDLVIAATDDNNAQYLVAHLAYWHKKPALFPGLYRKASGGEIILSTAMTPCWDCCTAGIRTAGAEPELASPNYGTNRLEAEPGLLADIHHLASAAVKLGLGLLEEDPECAAHALTQRVLSEKSTYGVFSMMPDYWLFPQLLADAAGQISHQSAWMNVTARDECVICGESRRDPYESNRLKPASGGFASLKNAVTSVLSRSLGS